VSEWAPPRDGCRDLWAAVLAQAARDATARTTKAKEKGSSSVPTAEHVLEARRFFLFRQGPWAESREMIAGILGICPDTLRERISRDGDTIADRFLQRAERWARHGRDDDALEVGEA